MSNMVNIVNMEHGKRGISGLRDIRFVVMLSEQEDTDIQAFRFTRRIGSKGEAMRQLIRKGLEAEKMATTGSKFGDQNPVEAGNSSNLEKADAERT